MPLLTCGAAESKGGFRADRYPSAMTELTREADMRSSEGNDGGFPARERTGNS
jgi:hypothetical protein